MYITRQDNSEEDISQKVQCDKRKYCKELPCKVNVFCSVFCIGHLTQMHYNTQTIVDSIHLAVDTGIHNIIVTGDFNIDMANPILAKKIDSICQLFSFTQCITDHTHFTENSSSLLDIVLTSNKNLIVASGVSEPFLQQNIRYHCPIYGLLNLKRSKYKII